MKFRPDLRTVAEIQRKVIKRGTRSAVSRLFHAKNNKEKIAAWRVNLNRILLVFNVGSAVSWWLLFTVHPQTELAINTHVTVLDIHHDVVDTHAIVSDVHHDVTNTHSLVSDVHHDVANTHAIVTELHHSVTNTHTIVSDIQRNMLKRGEGADGQQRMVSETHALYVAEQILTTTQTQNKSAV